MTFAERLKQLRAETNITMDELGRLIGVSKATIYRYENGIIENVPTKKVYQIANIFGVTRPYMMGWTDERKVDPVKNLHTVAEKLRNKHSTARITRWRSTGYDTEDCIEAATQATRAIIKFGISRSPIYPHQVLQKSEVATMVSFANVSELDNILMNANLFSYRMQNDIATAFYKEDEHGRRKYIFALNRDAPLGKSRLALAVELGHAYLGHERILLDTQQKDNEAKCFAIHFEFPRPLIKLLMERGFVFSKESFERVFGDCEWCLESILNASPISISPELNRMAKDLFIPHVNMLEETGILSMPTYNQEILDLSNYMAGYED